VCTSGMPLGLFTGARRYTLTPSAQDGVTFAMREEYSGPLAPLIARLIPNLQPSFEAFAADLKRRAENVTREPVDRTPIRGSRSNGAGYAASGIK
jgi:hypothetical protein